MSRKPTKNVATAIGAAFAGSMLIAGGAHAAENPFGLSELAGGYAQLAGSHVEGKCATGKCGGNAKMADGKCATGRCGGNAKMADGKCAAGSCGGSAKMADGKCGAGKCGGNAEMAEGKDRGGAKMTEGKCGEGKCGGAK
ncbi:MAG: low-complexity protein [Sedimenticolaceae bacterium]